MQSYERRRQNEQCWFVVDSASLAALVLLISGGRAGARWPSGGRRRPAWSAYGLRSTSRSPAGSRRRGRRRGRPCPRRCGARPLHLESPLHQIVRWCCGRVSTRAALAPAQVHALDASEAHEPGHPLASHADAVAECELGVDPRASVGLAGGGVDLGDGGGELGRPARFVPTGGGDAGPSRRTRWSTRKGSGTAR